jgi:hypothetical protein
MHRKSLLWSLPANLRGAAEQCPDSFQNDTPSGKEVQRSIQSFATVTNCISEIVPLYPYFLGDENPEEAKITLDRGVRDTTR